MSQSLIAPEASPIAAHLPSGLKAIACAAAVPASRSCCGTLVRPTPEFHFAISARGQQFAVGAEGQRLHQIEVGHAGILIRGPLLTSAGSVSRVINWPEGRW